MTLAVHVAAPVPDRLDDVSPLVFSRRSRSLYVAPSLGRGGHYRVYNLMQRLSTVGPAAARDAHGYFRPDGGFEWDEHFPVPDRREEEEIRLAIDALVDPGKTPVRRRAGLAPLVRRRLRPLRVVAKRIAAGGGVLLRPLLHPPRPPRETPEQIEDLSQVEPYREFLSGNGFASVCRHVLNYDALSVNEEGEDGWWFCKSDWLEYFFRELAPRSPFVLFTSNSDRTIGRGFARYLRRPELTAWFAVNVGFRHPKLHSIPLGIGDPTVRYGHTGERLRELQREGIPKTRLVEVSFNLATNPVERLRCLAGTGLELDPPAGAGYLERLASSYFCVAPAGNGIDTHRMWEALYLRTIPVVTRSLLTQQHPDLPLLVLDDWEALRSIELSLDLHAEIWGDFDLATLSLDGYLERVRATLGESAS